MGTIRFLYLRTLKNRVKNALRKPVTYVYLFVILLYAFLIPTSFRAMVEEFNANSPAGMAGALTLLAFWLVPGNFIAYAKRKGLVYRNGDVHFLFPSPISPKVVLLYAHLKGIFAHILLNLIVIYCGGIMFRVEGWKLAVYFVFAVGVENVLEGCVMMLLYGTERLSDRQRGVLVKAAYVLAAVPLAIGVAVYLQKGLSMESFGYFLNGNAVQFVPVIGWYISVIHLLFTGATTVNVIGTVLYFALLACVIVMACRMKCTGAFYEDAVKFAEDYEEVLANRRQGNTEKRLGKKQKFNKARAVWKGKGARALFYRQLLEYKKNPCFIFDINTVFAVIVGAGIAYLYVHEGGFGDFEFMAPFILPVVSAYLIFIFTTLNGKWAKELKSPYTYLIPDSQWKKLWYATAMQHIQSLVNGMLITLPAAIVMKLPPLITVLCILFYIVLSANKLYALAVAEAAVGSVLGTVGKQMFQLFIQGIVITVAILGAFLGYRVGGLTLSYVLMDVLMMLATFIFMVLATLNFDHLETA